MMSLFSSFDLFFNYFLIFSFMFIFFFLVSKFYKLSMIKVLNLLFKIFKSFFLSLKPKMHNKYSLFMIMTIMVSIVSINFSSILPFIFPITSQFSVIFMLALMFWFSFILFSIYNNKESFMLHLSPESSPIYLIPLLVAIELISSMIRPITLSVRLVANILAGHLLMILLSKLVFLKSYLFFFYILLNTVELFVAFIQSYIFCTMISLYFSEVN